MSHVERWLEAIYAHVTIGFFIAIFGFAASLVDPSWLSLAHLIVGAVTHTLQKVLVPKKPEDFGSDIKQLQDRLGRLELRSGIGR